MKNFKLIALLFVGSLLISSCAKHLPKLEQDPNATSQNATGMDDVKASANFNWETSTIASIEIQTLDNADNAFPNVKVSILTDFTTQGGSVIINGISNENGLFELDYNFPGHLTEVVVVTDHIGFVNEAKVPIVAGSINYTLGGSEETALNQDFTPAPLTKALKASSATNMTINYMGNYTNWGVPRYLAPKDQITNELMSQINTALPENRPVPTYHPEYLYDVNRQNLTLVEDADVWVTFVSEGAGYTNALGYYTYHRDFPPQSVDDIEECNIIFPNASFRGSGGRLKSGSKVYLGNFTAETVIGWVLLRNGWNQTSQTVGMGAGAIYSDKILNPESNEDHRQHVVLLHNEGDDTFVISFEDLIRPGGDNDFNDAIFYATVDPVDAVETINFPPLDSDPTDTDGDGIEDGIDEYPTDPELAFNNYYSSLDHFGTLAFEDLWPSKGDYDFNDLILDYNFNRITNAQNNVVKLEAKFVVRAIGASLHNGFGFEMEGIDPSDIEYINGQNLLNDIIITNANGTEAGQNNATVIVFDDAWDHGHANTKENQEFIVPDTMLITIKLSSPMDVADFGLAPFNPFIFVDGERGREVHLANYEPTDLVDASYFGQYSDRTNPAEGKYYKTEFNLPFGLNIASKLDYAIEKSPINDAHLKFINWIETSGSNYQDWYMNKSGYRNDLNIYHIN